VVSAASTAVAVVLVPLLRLDKTRPHTHKRLN
jgi:hypothetical protein